MTELQLLDHLTAQGDRHCHNYFIDIDAKTQEVKVTGIDNDLCFGPLVKNSLSMSAYSEHPALKTYGTYLRSGDLPIFIDQKMYSAIKNTTPTDLREMLAPMLNPEEVEAAVSRLEVVKTHNDHLLSMNHVIHQNQWSSHEIFAQMHSGNSYAIRDGQLAHYSRNNI